MRKTLAVAKLFKVAEAWGHDLSVAGCEHFLLASWSSDQTRSDIVALDWKTGDTLGVVPRWAMRAQSIARLAETMSGMVATTAEICMVAENIGVGYYSNPKLSLALAIEQSVTYGSLIAPGEGVMLDALTALRESWFGSSGLLAGSVVRGNGYGIVEGKDGRLYESALEREKTEKRYETGVYCISSALESEIRKHRAWRPSGKML